MEKIVIEHDLRSVEWEEDGGFDFSIPNLSAKQTENLEKAISFFYESVNGEDLLHYFVVINGNNVEIIPATKYLKEANNE